MVGGAFVASYGRWRCLFVFAAVQALAVASYAIAAAGWRDGWVLYALCTFEHFASGMATAALFTMMMDASRPRTAGTDYTIQASVVVLATGVGASLSGFSAARFGYTDHFLIAAGMCVLGTLPAVLHWRRVRRGETELANLP
jgi:predicted MFS family arabinose efflux permease